MTCFKVRQQAIGRILTCIITSILRCVFVSQAISNTSQHRRCGLEWRPPQPGNILTKEGCKCTAKGVESSMDVGKVPWIWYGDPTDVEAIRCNTDIEVPNKLMFRIEQGLLRLLCTKPHRKHQSVVRNLWYCTHLFNSVLSITFLGKISLQK